MGRRLSETRTLLLFRVFRGNLSPYAPEYQFLLLKFPFSTKPYSWQDGHLRVFAWPSCELVLDEPEAHRSIQDIDIRWLPVPHATPCFSLRTEF